MNCIGVQLVPPAGNRGFLDVQEYITGVTFQRVCVCVSGCSGFSSLLDIQAGGGADADGHRHRQRRRRHPRHPCGEFYGRTRRQIFQSKSPRPSFINRLSVWT